MRGAKELVAVSAAMLLLVLADSGEHGSLHAQSPAQQFKAAPMTPGVLKTPAPQQPIPALQQPKFVAPELLRRSPGSREITGVDFIARPESTGAAARPSPVAPSGGRREITGVDFVAKAPGGREISGVNFIAQSPGTREIAGLDFVAKTPGTREITGQDFVTRTPGTREITGADFRAMSPGTREIGGVDFTAR